MSPKNETQSNSSQEAMTSKEKLKAKVAEIEEAKRELEELDRETARQEKEIQDELDLHTEKLMDQRVEDFKGLEDTGVPQAETKKNAPSAPKPAPKPAPKASRVPYSTPSPFGEREPRRNTDADVRLLEENYAKKGMSQITAELSKLPEFQSLSNGQKMLVLQGASDKLLEYVSENATRAFRGKVQSVEDKYVATPDAEQKGRFGRIATAVQKSLDKARFTARKGQLTAKYKKGLLNDALGKDAGKFIATVAPELLMVLGDSGLESYLDRDGKNVVTDFARLEDASPLTKQMADEYNMAASALARIPREWGFDSATGKQKEAYKEAELAMIAAKDRFAPELIEHARRLGNAERPEVFAATHLLQSETLISTMSYLSAHPDAAKRIDQISKQHSVVQAVNDVWVERGTMAVASGAIGGIVKKALIWTGPFVSGVIGYYRGKARAENSFKDQDRLARRGQAQKGNSAVLMGNAERQLFYLKKYTDQLLNADSPAERVKCAAELKTRADAIEAKLRIGQVNFGGTEGRFMRQYELGKILHEAHTAVAVHSNEATIANIFLNEGNLGTEDVAARKFLAGMGAENKAIVSQEREKEIRKQALWSGTYGAIFGSAGVGMRYLSQEFGLFGGVHHVSPHHTASHATVPKIPAHHTPEVHAAKHFSYDARALKDYHENARDGESFADYTNRIKMNEALSEKIAHAKLEKSSVHVTASGSLVEHPSPAPVTPAVAHVGAEIAVSSKGFEQTLLDFRHSAEFKNLSPEQQAFFKGNTAKIAKELKALRTGASGNESLNVGTGSKFGVTADGKIFVTDTLHGGKPVTLGHFENGAFKPESAGSELHYMSAHAKGRSASAAEHARTAAKGSGKVDKRTLESLGLRTKEDVVSNSASASPVSYEEITPAQQRAMGMYNDDLKDVDPSYEAYTDPHTYSPEQELTPGKLARVDRVADRMARHQVNRFFSYMDKTGRMVRGQNSEVWKSYKFTPARSILSQDTRDFQPFMRPFVRHLRALADKYPEIDRSTSLTRFMQEAYKFKAEDRVLGEHYAELAD